MSGCRLASRLIWSAVLARLFGRSADRGTTLALAAASLTLALAAAAGMEGTLFRYRTSPGSLQAFMSPAEHAHTRYVIYLGGLTDGLLACSYVEELAAECDRKGWAFVQPVIRSSYAGYGCSSLANDVADVSDLVTYLTRTHDAAAFAVVGHSTGCQDIVQLMATAPAAVRAKIRAVVLQAPVSDREAASLEDDAPGRAANLARAQQLVAEGRPEALLPELHYGFVPINAARYCSLFGRGGDDDLFSSDFTDAELQARLGHMSTPNPNPNPSPTPTQARLGHMSTRGQREACGELATEAVPDHPGLLSLFVHSAADEYVPPSVDAAALSRRFVAAADSGAADSGGGARALLVEGANHNLASPDGAAATFVRAVG